MKKLIATASSVGVKVTGSIKVCDCHACLQAKSKRTQVGKSTSHREQAKATMDCIHGDLLGPFNVTVYGTQKERVKSLGGGLYVLVLVEEYSKAVFVRVLRHKSDAAPEIKAVLTLLHTQTGKKLKKFHTDGAKDFINTTLKAFFNEHGTIQSVTPAYSPALNGVAERMNRTLLEMTRAMLIQSGAPLSLWGEAIQVAAFTRNCTVHNYGNGLFDTPNNRLFGSCTNPSKLRVFGCDVWFTLSEKERSKLGNRAEKAMFIGYTPDGRAYRIIRLTDPFRPIVARDVAFDERNFTASAQLLVDLYDQRQHDAANARSTTQFHPNLFNGSSADDISQLDISHSSSPVPGDADDVDVITTTSLVPVVEPVPTVLTEDTSVRVIESETTTVTLDPIQESDSELERENVENDEEYTESTPIPSSTEPVRRSSRITRPADNGPYLNSDALLYSLLAAVAVDASASLEPNSYKQALRRSPEEAEKWQKAIQTELDSMFENEVWTLVKPPPGAKIIKSRWVFKIKLDEHNLPVRYKARLVAKGYEQIYGVNYDDTYAPVAQHKSIRLLLSIVTELDLELKQIDFTTAFLNAPLDYEIHMEQPEGLSSRGDGRVLLLNRALYGLKQSPRQWNSQLHNWLINHDYRSIPQDPCIYVKTTVNNRLILLAVYVDDTAIAYHKQDESIWEEDKAALIADFPITDAGDCRWLLGMEIRRDRAKGELTLSQAAYTERILKQFDMLECRTRDIPMEHEGKLGDRPLDGTDPILLDEAGKRHYQSIIGSLLYAAVMTRMDLSYATSKLAQFCSAPCKHHLHAAQVALRYLSGTRNLGLLLKRSNRKIHMNPSVYPDASWISEIDTGRSHSGVITLLNGNPVHWWSKRQSMVALSSTEAEYIAMGDAAKDAVWLREWLLSVFGLAIPVRIICDNQAAIKIVENNTDSARTRHYAARHHYVRELVKEN
jgi:hypothetical protein